MSTSKLPFVAINLCKGDPRTTTGGVQTFARNLALSFASVDFMTPDTLDVDRIRRERIPLICDNQTVLCVPDDVPVIGWQHGVGLEKLLATREPWRIALAVQQYRAAKRKNTLWCAGARWIGEYFGKISGNAAKHVIYYPVDTDRFDGMLDNAGSNLILHDGRTPHKGKHLIAELVKAFPRWRFESLACKPAEVPDRMRKARAFIHLSRYEGNSIVCNEAMAMDLPCLFTDVGLLRDVNRPSDIQVIPMKRAFSDPAFLVRETGTFLASLETRRYNPRGWALQNITQAHAIAGWTEIMASFQALSGWDFKRA